MAFYQCVATDGNDSNSGLSWATAKLTVQAAVAALTSGGVIYVAPGTYEVASTINLAGHSLIGMGGTRNDLGYTYGAVRLNHAFSGDLISLGSSWGNRIENVGLYENTYNQGGAAIKTVTGATPRGYLYLRDIEITGAGWENGIYIDASAAAGGSSGGGYRSTWMNNVYVFGCVNNNFYAHTLLHAWINGCSFNPAITGSGLGGGLVNAAGKAYVTIAGANSRDIHMHGMDLFGGDLSCAGNAGGGVHPSYFSGNAGDVTFTGAYNHFRGLITGTFSNGGVSTNKYLNEFTGTLT